MADADKNDLVAAVLGEAAADQRLRQERLRHAREFLASPLFVEMRDAPLRVSDDAAALASRRADLDYRIAVLESLLALLIEERALLDRAEPPQT